jgi:hypothetical protein
MMTKSGKLSAANYEIKIDAEGTSIVQAWRDYPAGVPPTTAQRVWSIVANFGGIKTIFPDVLSVYLTYPDNTDAAINTVRYITFTPPNSQNPLSSKNPLPFSVEQLLELDGQARRLVYTSTLGMPVKNYRSVMEVNGEDACQLIWTSSFTMDTDQEGFVDSLAMILANGTNRIAMILGLE